MARAPQISGTNVVWVGDNGFGTLEQVFFFDGLTLPRQISNIQSGMAELSPQMSGSNVAWLDGSLPDFPIFFFNGSSTVQISTTERNSGIDLSGSNVVWSGLAQGGLYQIYLFNGSSTVDLSQSSYGGCGEAHVSGSDIAWSEFDENYNKHIFFYNGSDTEKISAATSGGSFSQISGMNIAWIGRDENNNESLYLSSVSNGTTVGLEDAIIALRVLTQSGENQVPGGISDVDGDNKIGLAEVISVLQINSQNPDIDNDNDGFSENQGDCNDSSDAIYPGATDICGDSIDQDCSGSDLSCGTQCLQGQVFDGLTCVVMENCVCTPIESFDCDEGSNSIDCNMYQADCGDFWFFATSVFATGDTGSGYMTVWGTRDSETNDLITQVGFEGNHLDDMRATMCTNL